MDPIAITDDQEAELNRILEDEADNETIEESDPIEDNHDSGSQSDSDGDAVEWIDLPQNDGFPMPRNCMDDAYALPKQENDRISGNLAFSVRVSIHKTHSAWREYWIKLCIIIKCHPQKNGSRIYKVGDRKIQISKLLIVITKALGWLTFPFNRHTKYDRKLVESLLILSVGSTNITSDRIDQDVKKFIHGIDNSILIFVKNIHISRLLHSILYLYI